MEIIRKFMCATLYFLILPSVSYAKDACKIPSETMDLLEVDPDFRATLEAKDNHPHFLGVAGYSVVTPGAEEVAYCSKMPNMVRVISGTSDTPCSDALKMLQIAAGLYAKQYNLKLRQLRPDLETQIQTCSLGRK